MALVVLAFGAGGLFYVERRAAEAANAEWRRDFQTALENLRAVRQSRIEELSRRCELLARKPRIHAALEDDALDLLYLSSHDELKDLMETSGGGARGLGAEFYRFVNASGEVLAPPEQSGGLGTDSVRRKMDGLTETRGHLSPGEQERLALPHLPTSPQLGYLPREGTAGFAEVIATPIFSTANGRPIAALLVGFSPDFAATQVDGVRRGLWMGDRLEMDGLSPESAAELKRQLQSQYGRDQREINLSLKLGGQDYFVFAQPLNVGSLFPIAHEVCLYATNEYVNQQQILRWEIAGVCAVFLGLALGASHLLAARLSHPVEKLAVVSAVNAAERTRAEAALVQTQAELQRAGRFSANASHELKTPIAVLRAGLDELLARDDLTAAAREEVTALIAETSRCTHIVEDLLLLSRMDAGRLQIEFAIVDLSLLVETCLDDLSILPDPFELKIEVTLPPTLQVSGEKRYLAHILQNLLENARRYNRPGGRIRISATELGDHVLLTIGNTGRSIPPDLQPHIFERFERGAAGAAIPGHGLGLNLARDLARLHRGDVRLLRSADDWTEFEVVLLKATSLAHPTAVS